MKASRILARIVLRQHHPRVAGLPRAAWAELGKHTKTWQRKVGRALFRCTARAPGMPLRSLGFLGLYSAAKNPTNAKHEVSRLGKRGRNGAPGLSEQVSSPCSQLLQDPSWGSRHRLGLLHQLLRETGSRPCPLNARAGNKSLVRLSPQRCQLMGEEVCSEPHCIGRSTCPQG